jgi:hypothetical protein
MPAARVTVGALILALSVSVPFLVFASQTTTPSAPYRVVQRTKVGGAGGFDYVTADVEGRRLYVPRNGQGARISVFNLDTFAPVGEIPNVNARGVAIDARSGHGFSSSRPVAMWDTQTLSVLKTISVQGIPDGILADRFNDRIWIFSHTPPNATVLEGKDGAIVGTVDLGGAPEQAVSDGAGRLFVDLEDKNAVAVVDARSLTVTKVYDLSSAAKTPAGLALDAAHHILFAACRNAPTMVVLNADTGLVLATLPIGTGVDGAGFNASTDEAFSSQGDGTLSVIKEQSPTSFTVSQTVETMPSAKTMRLDSKTGRIVLIAAEYGPAESTPAPGRGGRGPMVPESFSLLAVSR